MLLGGSVFLLVKGFELGLCVGVFGVHLEGSGVVVLCRIFSFIMLALFQLCLACQIA